MFLPDLDPTPGIRGLPSSAGVRHTWVEWPWAGQSVSKLLFSHLWNEGQRQSVRVRHGLEEFGDSVVWTRLARHQAGSRSAHVADVISATGLLWGFNEITRVTCCRVTLGGAGVGTYAPTAASSTDKGQIHVPKTYKKRKGL